MARGKLSKIDRDRLADVHQEGRLSAELRRNPRPVVDGHKWLREYEWYKNLHDVNDVPPPPGKKHW